MDLLDLSRGAPPLYLQIKEFIMGRIVSGEYCFGGYIPTEQDFQSMFKVSRITVRQAINELQLEGYVKRGRGKGTEVIYRPSINEPLSGIRSFTDEMKGLGLNPGTSFVELSVEIPSINIREALGLDEGDKVLRIHRVRTVNNEPLVCFITHIAYNINFSLDKSVYEGSLYSYLNKVTGKTVAYVDETIGAVLAGEELGQLLKIKKNSPVLKRVRRSYDADNMPMEYTVGFYRADNYNYVVRMKS